MATWNCAISVAYSSDLGTGSKFRMCSKHLCMPVPASRFLSQLASTFLTACSSATSATMEWYLLEALLRQLVRFLAMTLRPSNRCSGGTACDISLVTETATFLPRTV